MKNWHEIILPGGNILASANNKFAHLVNIGWYVGAWNSERYGIRRDKGPAMLQNK